MTSEKQMNWGGLRPGAGRPKGSGNGPSPEARKNRVAVMFSDTELALLGDLAVISGKPVATMTYDLVARSLRGMTRRVR